MASRKHGLLWGAAILLLAGCADFGLAPGGGGDGGGPLTPPGSTDGLSAIGLLQAVPGPAGTTVSAQLGVIVGRGGQAAYAGGVARPTLVQGEASLDLFSTGQNSGLYATDNVRDRALAYTPGATYDFAFDVVDAGGRRTSFRHRLAAPATLPRLELVETLVNFAGEPIEISATGYHDGVVVAVVQTADLRGTLVTPRVTFQSFGYQGPTTLRQALASLQTFRRPVMLVPGEAFPTPGAYRIEVHDYAVTTGTQTVPPLGPDALFLVGSAQVFLVSVE